MFGQSNLFLALIHLLHFSLAVPSPANGALSRDLATATDSLAPREFKEAKACLKADDKGPEVLDIRKLVEDIENRGAQTYLSAEKGGCHIEVHQTARISACLTSNPDAKKDYNYWEIAQIAKEVLGRCSGGGSNDIPSLNVSINNAALYSPEPPRGGS